LTESSASELDAVTDAVLLASRALVAVASRSIAAVDDDVTLQQFRALVVLDREGGRINVGRLAEELGIQPSTATRLCDRLVAKRLIRRRVDPANRREVNVQLTPLARRVVTEVTERRRAEIASILSAVPLAERHTIVEALMAFCNAAGEPSADRSVPW
jgi:DNA-binding MarR family transcriptional regulator